jgi:hypothetical protein
MKPPSVKKANSRINSNILWISTAAMHRSQWHNCTRTCSDPPSSGNIGWAGMELAGKVHQIEFTENSHFYCGPVNWCSTTTHHTHHNTTQHTTHTTHTTTHHTPQHTTHHTPHTHTHNTPQHTTHHTHHTHHTHTYNTPHTTTHIYIMIKWLNVPLNLIPTVPHVTCR